MTLFSSTITPSTTSERAPIKQLSSMITGLACSGSSTPPMPTPPQRRTFFPLSHTEPTGHEIGLGVRGELARHLVVELRITAGRHDGVVLETKRQQHGFLDPL